jgi:hypothetical protein
MKKIVYGMLAVFAVLLSFTSCSPSHEDFSPKASISSDQLTASLILTQQSPGNNNFTISTSSPTRYIKVINANTNAEMGNGTTVSVQVVPPDKALNMYIETMNEDGSITKSATKSVAVTEYTDLPAVFNTVFGRDGKGGYLTSKWTWDDSKTIYWGNGSWGSDVIGSWWGAPKNATIDDQATAKGLPDDGSNGWFTLSLGGVTTSRGETGTVAVSQTSLVAGWGVGSMTFAGTVPLMGIKPNDGNARCYSYEIISSDSTHLVLALQSNSKTEGWFLAFKRIPNP